MAKASVAGARGELCYCSASRIIICTGKKRFRTKDTTAALEGPEIGVSDAMWRKRATRVRAPGSRMAVAG